MLTTKDVAHSLRLLTLPFLAVGLASTANAQSDAMFIDNTGNLGVGTSSPLNKVHVAGTTDATIRVQNSGGAAAERVLLNLNNNGKTRFLLVSSGQAWTFDVTPGGGSSFFTISRVGTGDSELSIDGNGNGNFRGNVTANSVMLTSSREKKENFVEINEADMLSKLSGLEISKWSYKTDAASRQHVGPVAEDFQQIFGLGDGKTISAGDVGGIAFASIKALNEQLDSERAKVAALEKSQALLLKRLEALEQQSVSRTQVDANLLSMNNAVH